MSVKHAQKHTKQMQDVVSMDIDMASFHFCVDAEILILNRVVKGTGLSDYVTWYV